MKFTSDEPISTGVSQDSFFHQADLTIITDGPDAGMVKVEINKPLRGRSRIEVFEEKQIVAAMILAKVGGKSMAEAKKEDVFIGS